MMPFDATPDPDDDDDALQAAIAAEADTFRTRIEAAEPELRKLGVYLDHAPIPHVVPTPFGVKPAMVLVANLGDVAFTRRVQDPEGHAMDTQFAGIESGANADEFLDARAEYVAKLREARGEEG